MAESLTFPPLVLGPDSHGQTEVSVNVKVNIYWSLYNTYHLDNTVLHGMVTGM